MITTPDGVALYSEEDVRSQFIAGTEYGVRATKNDLQAKAIKYFYEEVREGTICQEDALGIYNGLAEALGWAPLDSFTTKFTVVVSYNGMDIGEFNDVEADSASDAEEEVRLNMNVDDVEVRFTLAYGEKSGDGSVNMTYDWDDDFEFNAIEQD
jgi:hypothetical protein